MGRAGQQLPQALGFALKEHLGSWQTWPSSTQMSLSWGWLAPLEKCGSWKAIFSFESLPGPGQVGGEWDAELRLTRGGPVTNPGDGLLSSSGDWPVATRLFSAAPPTNLNSLRFQDSHSVVVVVIVLRPGFLTRIRSSKFVSVCACMGMYGRGLFVCVWGACRVWYSFACSCLSGSNSAFIDISFGRY